MPFTFMPVPGSFPAGTVALPGAYVRGDRDTGFWSSGANIVNLSVGGAEIAEFDATDITFAPSVDIADTTASTSATGIYQKNPQSVLDNTTTVIATSSDGMAGGVTGGFGMVIGRKNDNSENQFQDLIIIPRGSGSTIVKAASTKDGTAPTTRTYTMSAERQISLLHTGGGGA